MPATHLVHTILRPGIKSIQVQYRYQSAEVWTNYRDGQRIPGGVVVKFTVTTYTNFTLTDWEAYYSDEYDDTVSVTLTPITGESSWTFILPSADVYIRCEASGGSGSDKYPPYQETGTFTFETKSSIRDAIDYVIDLHRTNYGNVDGYRSPVLNEAYVLNGRTIGSILDEIDRLPYFSQVTMSLTLYDGRITSSSRYTISVAVCIGTRNDYYPPATLTLGSPTSGAISQWEYPYLNFYLKLNATNMSFVNIEEYAASYPIFVGPKLWERANGPLTQYASVYNITTGGSSVDSIRYIMSPENSGEIDESAPSEFEQGTTEFTFKWRIKAAYEFKRLIPFAVGDPPLEDDVSYSLQYDGDTRTYTFTVSGIPDWAKGVRVLIETIMVDDPNSPIGENTSDGPIGGNGTFDDTSDEVPLPAIPEGVSAPDTGFVTLFRPTIAQITALSNYMWSNMSEFIENLQKIFTNPMDYVISLASFPVTPDVGPDKNIYVGNFLTDIQMPPITRQFYEFNCGTVAISEYFGSFLDYSPNTKARIMLPFIGDADLAVDEIMGKTLHLWYRIDLLSGACVAVLTINNSVYYQWTGNCSIQIPVTASDYSRLYAGIARVGITAAAIAGGGAYIGALASAASNWNTANSGWHDVSGVVGQSASPPPNFGVPALPPSYGQLSTDRGPQLNTGDYLSYTPPIQIPSKKSRAVAAAAGGSFVGHNVMNAIPRVQHAGGMSGNIGIMGNRTPFIVLEYPNVSMPDNYKHVFGYPSNMYKVLGNLAGYTKCKQVLFESTKATDDEYEMVIEALKGGVYL